MSEAGSNLRVIGTTGVVRKLRTSVERRATFTPAMVGDPMLLAETLQGVSRTIEALQRSKPRPRVLFRVAMDTGGSYITHRLRHGLGGDVIVRLECVESAFAGTIAPAINYQTDASTADVATVHIARSGTGPYVAVIGIEAL